MHKHNRLVSLLALGCLGLAILGCIATDLLAELSSDSTGSAAANTPTLGGERITLDNAKRVAHLSRASEGSFIAQSAWSLDGRMLALPSAYGVYLFDANTLTQLRFIEEADRVEKIAFSPDGNWLAIDTSRSTPWSSDKTVPVADHTVRLWRVSDASLVREVPGEAWVGSAMFSPDNGQMATQSAQATARLWRISDGTLAREIKLRLPDDKDPLARIAFSPDWRVAMTISASASSGANKTRIRLWQISDGSFLRELTEAEADLDNADNVTFNSDGTLVVSTNALYIKNAIGQPRSGTAIRLWRVSDGGLAREWKEERVIARVAFSPDGSALLLTDSEKTRIRRVSDGSLVRDLNGAWSVVSSPDGKLIASRNETHMINDFFALCIWRVSDGNLVRAVKEQFAVDGIAFSSDASVLAAGRLWRVSDGKFTRASQLNGLNDHVDSLAVSRDGKLAATGGLRNLRLWQLSDGSLVREEKGFAGKVGVVAFSPDATLLVSASTDRAVQLWRVSDGSRVRALSGHAEDLTGIVFSPDGNWLATATRNTVRLWRVNDGSLVREAKGGWRSVSFSPDASLLAATDAGGTLGLWRISDGSLVRELPVADVVSGTAFSSDGSVLAVMYLGGTLRLWRVSDGNLMHEVKDKYFIGLGESVAFNRDESVLVSGSGANLSIGVWGIPKIR